MTDIGTIRLSSDLHRTEPAKRGIPYGEARASLGRWRMEMQIPTDEGCVGAVWWVSSEEDATRALEALCAARSDMTRSEAAFLLGELSGRPVA